MTNRPGWHVLPAAVYDEYAERGESENRNKELKSELQADRLSDHRFMANFFQLYLHAATLNLLVRLRRALVLPPPTPEEMSLPAELPIAAIDEPQCKKFFNRRRKHDPLGEGFACTWRTHLIKVAAEVITLARRVIVRLSASWPYLDHFLAVSTPLTASPAGSLGPLRAVPQRPKPETIEPGVGATLRSTEDRSDSTPSGDPRGQLHECVRIIRVKQIAPAPPRRGEKDRRLSADTKARTNENQVETPPTLDATPAKKKTSARRARSGR